MMLRSDDVDPFLAQGPQTIMMPAGGLICLGIAAVVIVVVPIVLAITAIVVGLRLRRAERKET
jgi:hypothetical protein